jgi:hypothetical protein
MKLRTRDYIDLFFVLKETDYTIPKLVLDAKAKFDWHIDPLGLASQFLKVKDLTEFSRMLKPFNKKDMENFFINQAKKLKKEIFE